jgi:hypothetical protein
MADMAESEGNPPRATIFSREIPLYSRCTFAQVPDILELVRGRFREVVIAFSFEGAPWVN